MVKLVRVIGNIAVTASTGVGGEPLCCAGGSRDYCFVIMTCKLCNGFGVGIAAFTGEGFNTFGQVCCRCGDFGSVAVVKLVRVIGNITVTAFAGVGGVTLCCTSRCRDGCSVRMTVRRHKRYKCATVFFGISLCGGISIAINCGGVVNGEFAVINFTIRIEDGDRGKLCAAVERILPDARHAVRDDNRGQ